MRASFRSQLVAGSVLWTLGLLTFISIAAIHLLSTHPRQHAFIYDSFFNAPTVIVLVGYLAWLVEVLWGPGR